MTKLICKNIFSSRRSSQDSVRRLGTSEVVGRAKMKSVKVMGLLVCGFILCWTPYYVMSLWSDNIH